MIEFERREVALGDRSRHVHRVGPGDLIESLRIGAAVLDRGAQLVEVASASSFAGQGRPRETLLHHIQHDCYHAGMIRTQISLTEDQMRRLRREARSRHMSLAAVIRDAVDRVVPDEDARRRDRIETLLTAAGSATSGTGRVARDHDAELAGDRW